MVEMEMRVDDEVDARRVAADRLEPGADLLARTKADLEEAGEPSPEPPDRVTLAIGMEAGIEQRPSLWMLDQEHWDRHGDLALAALHQMGELAGDRATGERVEAH
jgi:hypothetical protein